MPLDLQETLVSEGKRNQIIFQSLTPSRTQVLSTVSVAKNPSIRFPLAKPFSQAILRATATLPESAAPIDTAMHTVTLSIATALMVGCP